DRPVYLERVDGHAALANAAAMRAAGVTAATRDPSGGRVERGAGGAPTGVFVDNAQGLVERSIPAPTTDELRERVRAATKELHRWGLVGVHDAGEPRRVIDLMEEMAKGGELDLRAYVMVSDDSADVAHYLARGPQSALYGGRVWVRAIKLYADGALGSRGAWLKRPYADKPDTRGLQFHSDAELLSLADRAAAVGFQVATHAIGDAANAQVIGVYEQLSRKYGTDRRWRIEHLQIADPADIPRLAPAGIIASMQPTHQTSDRLMAEKRLGPTRLVGAYAWRTVLKSGARLAFGTDFPVESPDPFPGLAAAISRQDMAGQPPGGWIPSERLNFEQALSAYTRGAAYAGFAEDRIGSLETGKWADFIIVDRDPTKVDAQTLGRTQVLETWVAGKKVWQRPASASPTERGR
ncbi:MAG: amidohydrolase, partial [Sphingomicrobium sp.]